MAREINAARLSNAPAAHEMNTCGIREMQHKCCVVAEIIKLYILPFASEINAISLVISTERKRAEKSRRCHCPSLLLRDVSTALNMTMAAQTRLRRHFTSRAMSAAFHRPPDYPFTMPRSTSKFQILSPVCHFVPEQSTGVKYAYLPMNER